MYEQTVALPQWKNVFRGDQILINTPGAAVCWQWSSLCRGVLGIQSRIRTVSLHLMPAKSSHSYDDCGFRYSPQPSPHTSCTRISEQFPIAGRSICSSTFKCIAKAFISGFWAEKLGGVCVGVLAPKWFTDVPGKGLWFSFVNIYSTPLSQNMAACLWLFPDSLDTISLSMKTFLDMD